MGERYGTYITLGGDMFGRRIVGVVVAVSVVVVVAVVVVVVLLRS